MTRRGHVTHISPSKLCNTHRKHCPPSTCPRADLRTATELSSSLPRQTGTPSPMSSACTPTAASRALSTVNFNSPIMVECGKRCVGLTPSTPDSCAEAGRLAEKEEEAWLVIG